MGHGPGDGPRIRRSRHRRRRLRRSRRHPGNHRPAPQRAGHRGQGRRSGGGGLQSHRRLRHGRPADHHGPELHVVVATRTQITAYIGQGLQQRQRRRRHGHGGLAERRRLELRVGYRRHPGRHRGSTHRSLRESPHPAGPQRAGLRHPRRAHRDRPPHPVPDRRRAPRRLDGTADHRPGGDHPPEGHGRHERGRAPRSPGRPHLPQCGEQGYRPADGHPSDHPRREGGHAGAGQVERRARIRRRWDSTTTSWSPTRASTPSRTGPSW